ncbi:MAG TPA: HAMP domain-containing sensor histidine kinase [Rhizomicrobium sp.]|jgi:signal transduction histidine kinase
MKIAPRPSFRLDSLQARLIAAAAVWTLLGLIVGGFLLSGVFRASVQSNFDARMRFDLDGMIAAAEPDKSGNVSLQGRFADPRFERAFSGWYWQIVPYGPHGADLPRSQISRSLFDRTIRVLDSRSVGGGVSWGHGLGPEDHPVRFVSQHVEFPVSATPNPSDVRSYDFVVAGETRDLDAEVDRFNGTLIWSFAVLGLGLIGGIFFQVRIGLLPLRRVSQALARIRDGKARRLDGNFPAEIAPLAGELNSLIEHSAEVVGRARTHVSNLAHFLKTPLTVLSSEAAANPGPLADAVMRQVMTMRRQVDHYLARARAAGAVDVLGNRTPVKPVLDDLARVLMRIHAEHGVQISVECPVGLAFRGERQDLEEMAGNLIDNACKWAHSRVAVSAERDGAKFVVRVGDDGEGLDAEDRGKVGERGERLDESVPGTGLGLAIVRDVAKLYGGDFELGESPLGGLETKLTLPAIA